MKTICRLIALLLALAGSGSAAVNTLVSGGVLRDASGAPLLPGSLVVVVASTQDSAFQPPTALSSLQVGTTFGADDVIVGVFPADGLTTAVAGGVVGVVTFDYATMGIPNLGAGDPLTLYWFPAAGLNGVQVLPTATYGAYRSDALANRSTATWLAPDDSTGGNVELNYLTQAVGGQADDELAKAALTVAGAGSIAVTIQSSPAGRTFKVDDVSYASAQTFQWIPGSTHKIEALPAEGVTAGVQYAWTTWSDGGAYMHLVAPTTSTTYTATYVTEYYLATSADPGGTVSPASGWYVAGESVSLNATATNGFSFTGWTGSGAGSYNGQSNPVTVTMNGPVTETAGFAGAAGEDAYVTSIVAGTLRNDFTGWVGIQIAVGASPLNITKLGRLVLPGNTGAHTVKLVRANDGLDVAGSAVTLATSGGTAGRYHYAGVASPVTLAAYTTYWLVSLETVGGDQWYGADSAVTTTGVATDTGYVWSTGTGSWGTLPATNTGMAGVNFQYTVEPPATIAYVTNAVLGTLRNDYGGWVGMQFAVGANPLTVSELGRIVAPGNSAPHPLKLVNASDGSDVPGGAVTITTSGGTTGQFQYGRLPRPVSLAAGATYWLLSQESSAGELWYDSDTTVSTTSVAANTGFVWSTGPGTWGTSLATNRGIVPVNFKYVAPPPRRPYVTNTALGTLRNDFSGWVGIQIVVGASPLPVFELGRFMTAGNTGSHEVKLVQAANGLDVPGGAVTITTSGGTPGAFQYSPLPNPVTLAANSTYWLVSLEVAGGDRWYDSDTTVSTTGVAANTGYVWSTGPGTWGTFSAANRGAVPVNFKY